VVSAPARPPAEVVTTFASAARDYAQLVGRIPVDRWDGPGLGEWDLRALVGHASRSLTTVRLYLRTSAEHADLATPEDYYARIREYASTIGSAGIVERGRQAGRDLGADPAAAVDLLLAQVLADLDEAPDRLIRVIGDLGLRLYTYLPTRTFELAVHGMDIAAAAGLEFTSDPAVLDAATVLAGRIAVRTGDGPAVLMALTGRGGLPPGFSVV
jgi:hypothetical protein